MLVFDICGPLALLPTMETRRPWRKYPVSDTFGIHKDSIEWEQHFNNLGGPGSRIMGSAHNARSEHLSMCGMPFFAGAGEDSRSLMACRASQSADLG